MKRITLLFVIFVLAGCAGMAEKRLEETSTVYGWIKISGTPGSTHINSFYLKQAAPVRYNAPEYLAKAIEFEGGYLFWTHDAIDGVVVNSRFLSKNCLAGRFIGCSEQPTEYRWDGKGQAGKAEIPTPGTYFMGAYDVYDRTKGIISFLRYDAKPAESSPSQKAMLEAILKNSPKRYEDRLNQALQSM